VKLRSWNKKYKRFCYFDNGNYYFSASKDWQYTLNPINFDWGNAEQSTGLKDMNGNEIFVGDILQRRYNDYDGKPQTILFVVPKITDLYGDKIRQTDAKCSIELWQSDFKVIGNIHENKELMNESNS